jgi:nucleoside-diphosphate-sugar epimerase
LADRIQLVDIESGVDAIFRAHPEIEVIIHTATAYGHEKESLSELISSNVVMPLRLLEWSVAHKGCAFINSDTFFCKANDGYEHLAGYITSKKLFLQLAAGLSKANGATFCNMRIEHMYGPGDSEKKFTTNIVRQLLEDTSEVRLTPGMQVRDFVYIDDVVDAYLHVVRAIGNGTLKGVTAFEVGSGLPHTVADFVTLAHRISGSKSKMVFGGLPYRGNEIMHSQANLQALAELGWSPKVDLESGIELLVSFMRRSAESHSKRLH